MLKYIYNLLLLVLLLWSCSSKPKVYSSGELENSQFVETNDELLSSSLLWKIEGNGLANNSYLLGTIHLITAEDFFWPKGTLSSIENAESIVFEIDLDDMFDLSKQMSLMTKAFMKDGQSLKDLYSEEDYNEVKNHFDNMGIPMFFLEKLKPMFLTVFASGDMDMGDAMSGNGNMKSYEMEIYNLGNQMQKEIKGLETIEFQLSVFDSIPYQVQADMLLESIRTSKEGDDSFKAMVEMYKSQNINNMVESMSDDESISPYEDLLLSGRNKNWIPVMENMMKEQSVFFAVGAGHLAGEQGVINLLKEAGYTLIPLSNEL